MAEKVPLEEVTASEVPNAFVHYYVFNYGAPIWIISDNGRQCIAKLFRETGRMLKVKNSYATAYQSPTNEQVERFTCSISALLLHYVVNPSKDWGFFPGALL